MVMKERIKASCQRMPHGDPSPLARVSPVAMGMTPGASGRVVAGRSADDAEPAAHITMDYHRQKGMALPSPVFGFAGHRPAPDTQHRAL
jgi:hypothetical protein